MNLILTVMFAALAVTNDPQVVISNAPPKKALSAERRAEIMKAREARRKLRATNDVEKTNYQLYKEFLRGRRVERRKDRRPPDYKKKEEYYEK